MSKKNEQNKEEKPVQIEKSVVVKINGKNFVIEFPNIGQMMEIESKKTALSIGNYKDMISLGTKSSQFNLDLIDATATFSVLIPDLNVLFGVKTILDLSVLDGKRLVDSYNEFFYPWFKQIQEIIYE